ncbi:MAG: dTMP kinase, partial [Treponema sp.]|nr:dTMP kinase [Treponema sp.]
MILQNFIVFEGIDGAGTSTQIEMLKNRPEANDFLFTAEPTSAPTGKFLRQMLKGDFPLQNESAAYLFAADRNEHVNGKLLT